MDKNRGYFSANRRILMIAKWEKSVQDPLVKTKKVFIKANIFRQIHTCELTK
jgi:hypothetical protein